MLQDDLVIYGCVRNRDYFPKEQESIFRLIRKDNDLKIERKTLAKLTYVYTMHFKIVSNVDV